MVIASAFAAAQQVGAGGQAVLPAIVAGYEVMARVGAAAGAATVIEAGFHPTALFGSFGAATAVGRLLGLDADGLAAAWGLALSMTGGSMQFSQDPHATVVKRLHGGYAALHGTTAAELAAAGIAGPRQAFDGLYGLCRLYGDTPDLARLSKPKGAAWEIHNISFKPYPCCRLFHSTLDALEAATDGFRLSPDDIAAIRVGGPAILVAQHMLRRPTSMMAAQYSLPFTLATALYHGPRAVEGFGEAAMRDARVLAVADRVEAVTDPGMEAAFPRHFGSWVEVTTRAGETRRVSVLDSLGTPARPIPLEALADKFDELTRPSGLALSGREALALIQALPEAPDLDALLTPFAAPQ